MLTREEAIDCFRDFAYTYQDCEGIHDALDSMHECGEISDEDCDYIMKHWDELLPDDIDD